MGTKKLKLSRDDYDDLAELEVKLNRFMSENRGIFENWMYAKVFLKQGAYLWKCFEKDEEVWAKNVERSLLEGLVKWGEEL